MNETNEKIKSGYIRTNGLSYKKWNNCNGKVILGINLDDAMDDILTTINRNSKNAESIISVKWQHMHDIYIIKLLLY